MFPGRKRNSLTFLRTSGHARSLVVPHFFPLAEPVLHTYMTISCAEWRVILGDGRFIFFGTYGYLHVEEIEYLCVDRCR